MSSSRIDFQVIFHPIKPIDQVPTATVCNTKIKYTLDNGWQPIVFFLETN